MAEETSVPVSPTQAGFEKTHWTVVLQAARHSAAGAENLEKLCKIYWPPLYAFLRKQGHSPEDAKDLTQGFFACLLAKEGLQNVAPAKGKFRSFLLACLNNYVLNEHDRQRAQKRGGGVIPVPIDAVAAETSYSVEPSTTEDPARLFEHKWASTLIDSVLQQLKENYSGTGKSELFQTLHPFLTGDAARGGYVQAAVALKTTEGAARVAATRLRSDFRQLLRAEVGSTVDNPSEIDDEIRHLLSVMRGG